MIWQVGRAADADDLSKSEGEGLLDELGGLGPPGPLIVLTGVDPADPEVVDELLGYGTRHGLRMSIAVPPVPSLTRAVISGWYDAGAIAMVVSLHGATRTIDDRCRVRRGRFDHATSAMAVARDVGLAVQINTTVSTGNVFDLPNLLRLMVTEGVRMWSLSFAVTPGSGSHLRPLTPREEEDVLDWAYDVSGLIPIKTNEAPQYQRILRQRRGHRGIPPGGSIGRNLREATIDLVGHRLPRGPRHHPPMVNAGKGIVYIDRRGDVFPSGDLHVAVGSVRDCSLVDIYRSAPLLRSLRDPDALGGKCGICDFRAVCGGSRSRAWAATGDPLAADPNCIYAPGVEAPQPA